MFCAMLCVIVKLRRGVLDRRDVPEEFEEIKSLAISVNEEPCECSLYVRKLETLHGYSFRSFLS